MKLVNIQKKLLESKIKIFSKLEFRRLMGITRISAQKLLERYAKKGVFVRLKGGLYALSQNYPTGYLIANKLCEPSYVSFETALSYHNLIPETVYGFTSATTKTTRSFAVKEQLFKYHTIKKTAYTGYKLTNIAGENVLLAEKEKALADHLYYVFIKKKSLNERLRLKGVKRDKLFSYISLFAMPNFLKWVKNVIRTTT
jgi:predicted transcriptional regulator of viral defense system